jgi:vacuolar-type H+-ATPase subunit H
MTGTSEFLDTLLDESVDFARDELKELIKEAKNDNRVFIKHIGELTEEFIKLRALGQLTNDEFKELMEDVIDLKKMQFHKLSVQAKARAERISNGIRDLVLNSLMSLI